MICIQKSWAGGGQGEWGVNNLSYAARLQAVGLIILGKNWGLAGAAG